MIPPAVSPGTAGPFMRPVSANRFGGSRVITLAHHQMATDVGYVVTPLLRLDVLSIGDWNGARASPSQGGARARAMVPGWYLGPKNTELR